MGFIKEFKEFAMKGNVIDLAVGVIIGGAFGKIVDSVVKDLIMPLISSIVGSPDFTNLYYVLDKGVGDFSKKMSLEDARAVEGAVIFAYGNFITIFIQFILLAFAIFLMVKGINSLKRKEEEAPAAAPVKSSTDILLEEIRDELKRQ